MLRPHEEQAARLLVEMGVAACYRQEDDNSDERMMDIVLECSKGMCVAVEVTRYIDRVNVILNEWFEKVNPVSSEEISRNWHVAVRPSIVVTDQKGKKKATRFNHLKQQLPRLLRRVEQEFPDAGLLITGFGDPDIVGRPLVKQLHHLHVDNLIGIESAVPCITFSSATDVFNYSFENVAEAIESCVQENVTKLETAKSEKKYDQTGLFVWVPYGWEAEPGVLAALMNEWTLERVGRLPEMTNIDCAWIAVGASPYDGPEPVALPTKVFEARKDGWYLWQNVRTLEGAESKWRRTRLPMSAELIDDRRMT